MGWVVFLLGCFITIPAGWALLSRSKADRFLTVVGITLLPPTIWSAAIGLKIGPCKVGSCVSHTQHNLLIVAVPGLLVLAVALVALFQQRTVPGGALMLVAAVLGLISVVKIDTVSWVMFAILAAVVGIYLGVTIARSRPEARAEFPG